MRSVLRSLALTALLLSACSGWVGWGYGYCDPYYDPYCYDYHYYAWEPASLAADDLDGDGELDLAVADGQSSALWVLRGVPGGGFEPAPHAAHGVVAAARIVALFQANGDLHPDLLVLDGAPGVLATYLGDGHGGFTLLPPALQSVLAPSVWRFARGALNGDGFDDVVTLDQDGVVHVLLGTGTGSFTDVGLGDPARDFLGPDAAARRSGIHIALAEFDEQPGTDLLVLDGLSARCAVLSGRGDGTFGPSLPLQLSPLGEVLDIAPVVVRPGGLPELAVLLCRQQDPTSPSRLVVLRLSDGAQDAPEILVDSARSIMPRDVDGDGLTDLLLADQANRTIRTLHLRSR